MPSPALPDGSKLIVSLSGGKDSVATLLVALETFGPECVIVHHQIVLEDWPGTVEYCQSICDAVGVPLYLSQARYSGYACCQCQHRYLTSRSVQVCPQCKSHEVTFVQMVESVLDLVEWRRMWPSLGVRFCTSYFKRDNFNAWARANVALLGARPVIAMGERARESTNRARLPEVRFRSGLKEQWMREWRPILNYRRLDVFRKMRQYGLEPHPCYQAQWRELLRLRYPSLSEHELEVKREHLMYEVDEEGGPRMSCVMCFLKSAEQLKASYQIDAAKPMMDRSIHLEQTIGHTLKHGQSLENIIA